MLCKCCVQHQPLYKSDRIISMLIVVANQEEEEEEEGDIKETYNDQQKRE